MILNIQRNLIGPSPLVLAVALTSGLLVTTGCDTMMESSAPAPSAPVAYTPQWEHEIVYGSLGFGLKAEKAVSDKGIQLKIVSESEKDVYVNVECSGKFGIERPGGNHLENNLSFLVPSGQTVTRWVLQNPDPSNRMHTGGHFVNITTSEKPKY